MLRESNTFVSLGNKTVIFTLCFFLVLGTFHGLVGEASVRPGPTSRIDATALSIDLFNEDYAILTLEAEEPVLSTIETEDGTFTILTIPGMGYTREVGSPQLPYLSRLLAVPNTLVTVEILQEEHYTLDVGRIYPAQEPDPDKYPEANKEFKMDESAYTGENYPGEIVAVVDAGMIRVVPFARIGFFPVQYDPVAGTAEVYERLQVKVSWDANTDFQVEPRQNSPHFEPFYHNSFANWEDFRSTFSSELEQTQQKTRSPTGCEFLIITDPLFYDAAVALQEWRILRGIDTWVKNTTETGTDEPELKTYIENAYLTWDPSPSYVLFFGDAEHIKPLYYNIHPYHGTLTGTDLWYFTIMGMDYYPELFYGRIPVDTVADATTIINEIINYDKNPPYHSGFYNNVTVAAYFQDDENDGYETRRFVRTSEEVRDYLLTQGFGVQRIYVTEGSITPTHYNNGIYGDPIPGAPLPADLLRPLFLWDGDAADITARVNSGTLILNHRDHGSRAGWGDPYFHVPEIASFDNGDLLPVVFSINCETGWFDHETDGSGSTTTESFCEEFLRKEDGGTVGIFGASRVSYSGHNDYLCRGFYDAIWPEFDTTQGGSTPMYRMGEVLNYGKTFMANTWGDPWGREELTFELFHYFGDPTMELITAEPMDLDVTHPGSIYFNTAQIQIDVVQDGAYVILTNGNEIIGANYSAGGSAVIDVAPLAPGVIDVTATKHNYRPYFGSIDVIPNTAPLIDLTNPDAYDLLAGGSSITIWWNMSDVEDAVSDLMVDLYYSTDDGVTYPNTIATGLTGFVSNPCEYEWDPLPFIDSALVKVRAVVSDAYPWTDSDDSAESFEIDSTAPSPATNVIAELEGTGVRIYWDPSPSVDVDHYEVWYIMNDWDPTGGGYVSALPPTTGTDILQIGAGVNNGNSYFYQVRTFDMVGHETWTIVQAGKIGTTLSTFANPSGWFMLGSFLMQSDTSLGHVIQGQGFPTNWDYAQGYDPAGTGWESYLKGRPDTVNSLTNITNEDGFWLHVTGNSRWATAGHVTDMSIGLKAGWNLVPYPFVQRSKTAAEVESHLAVNCPNFDAWEMFDVGGDYRLKTPVGPEPLMHGDAFWVHVAADTTWTVTNY